MAEHRPLTTKRRVYQALAAFALVRVPSNSRQPQTSIGTEVTNPQKQDAKAGITCLAWMDSKKSEHPRAMGWSSGLRLSVDERLLARASSCTNMIPGETRGRRVGQRGRRAAIQQVGLGLWNTGMAEG